MISKFSQKKKTPKDCEFRQKIPKGMRIRSEDCEKHLNFGKSWQKQSNFGKKS